MWSSLFKRIAIANRGEIAVRILRTCQELGIETAVLHSDVDADSLAVGMADHAINIGDVWGYLDPEGIVRAAGNWGAEAIHPGYGFLAENPEFARLCASAGIAFIGPDADVMEHLGQKDRARASALKLDIPCLPGTETPIADIDSALAAAEAAGYPVLIKAVAGGGGRGMRLAHDDKQLRELFPRAMSEAEAAFKSPEVYIEKYLTGARHVEVQVLADSHGNVVHLGERDCTVQRRHQKLIEESPSPALDVETRTAMTDAATRLLRELRYVNAGTVEFLVDDEGRFYFLEVNTRIQVEHPVTEMIYGVDLIAEQIRIAAGKPLSWKQSDLKPSGWAIECRINAEDAARNFMPGPGLITSYLPPAGPGVRIDSAVRSGWQIPPHYDSMIAKVIVLAPDRDKAVARMIRALHEFHIEGVPTTIPFHLAVLNNADFASGRIDTNFAETNISPANLIKPAGGAARGSNAKLESAQEAAPGAAAHAPDATAAGTARVAAVAAAVAAVIDGPHRIVSISPATTPVGTMGGSVASGGVAPVPGPATGSFWGTGGRFDLMQRRNAIINPRRDRRT